MEAFSKTSHKYKPNKNHHKSRRKSSIRHSDDDSNHERTGKNNNNKSNNNRARSAPPSRLKLKRRDTDETSSSKAVDSDHSNYKSKSRTESVDRNDIGNKNSPHRKSVDKNDIVNENSHRRKSITSSQDKLNGETAKLGSATKIEKHGSEQNEQEEEVLALSVNEFGREKTVGSIESAALFNAKKEMYDYEKKKKKKKNKLRAEIEELRKKRDEMKVSIKLDQLKKETELLDKQKDLNEFEEKLLSRHEDVYDRENSLHETLQQLEQAEAAMDRRKDILQRKQEELTNMSHVKDLPSLQQQLNKTKESFRRKSDAGSSTQKLAQLNWDFLRSALHDRTAMISTELKVCKVDLLKAENQLREKTVEADKSKDQIEKLIIIVRKKEQKIKELEQHLTLTLEQQKNKKPKVDSQSDNKGYFSNQKSVNSPKKVVHYDEDKYVSQTCNVM